MARRKAVEFEVDTRVLDGMIKNLDGNVEAAVNTVAFAIEGRAKDNVQQMEAIDTGALLNSIAVSMQHGGDTQEAQRKAQSLNPDAVITPLPAPRDRHTAYIGPTVEYAQEVHNGTSRMAGRPYLAQAVRGVEGDFRQQLGKAVSNE